jgi:thiamine-monophosphate kinase
VITEVRVSTAMAASDPTSEFGLIDWIRERARASRSPLTKLGIGDDCAILDVASRLDLLVTTDMLMDGRHFRLEEDGPERVGCKAIGANLSDIAAMAGVPRAAVVAIALPRAGAGDLARGIYAGLAPLAERFGVDLIGGDTNAWNGPLVISVTLIGEATARGAVCRSGARPGDAILLTGALGGSLHSGRHLHPEPRVTEALLLHESASLHAMIDISDGLASDLPHILTESGGLGAVLEESAIPIHRDAQEMSRLDGVPAIEHALADGEDFELCVVVSAEDAARLLADPPAGTTLFRIGRITEAPGLELRTHEGSLRPISSRGFDHFRAPMY